MENIYSDQQVTLRTLEVEDLDFFFSWASDPEVAKTMTWHHYTSKEEALKFLTDIALPHPWFKAICVDGLPVGSITLTPGKGCFSHKAELGFVLSKMFWGKGLTTIAVKEALRTGFNDLKINRIEAFVDPDNIASQKVLIKSGMNCEGYLKDYMLFKGVVRDRYIYSVTFNESR